MSSPTRTATGPALAVALVAGTAFVVAAVLLVPWDPVPGGPVQPVDAGDYFTAEAIAEAEHFSAWARVWSWGSLALSLLVAGLLGFTRLGRRAMARLPGPWWLRVLLGVAGFLLVTRVVTLPFSFASRELRLRHGLTEQPLGGYLRDTVVSLAVSVVVTGLVLLVVVAVARRWRRWWPPIVATGLGAFVLAASFAYPVVIEPLFNDFKPLADGELRSAVFEIADAEDVELEDVLVADASRRTTTLNAYVSGFGETRRVVLYDTLMESVPRDQILAVVAHELAHAKNKDVVIGSVLGALGAAFAVGLAALLVERRLRSVEPRSSVESVETHCREDLVRLVPFVLALVAFGSLLGAPVQNTISRQIETRADVDALEATGDADGFIEVQVALARRSLSDPTPPALSQFWFGSHPTVLERIGLTDQGGVSSGGE